MAQVLAERVPGRAGFPGFGEDAPLDLPHLTRAEVAGLVGRIADRTASDFAEAAAGVHHCARPVRLVGHSQTVDATTGEVLSRCDSSDQPLGVLYRPCGNRRADVCPACSRTYARDTFAMIRAGVMGGKSVPEAVADNPLLFVTLTAPSFGPVHGPVCGTRARSGRGLRVCRHGRRLDCGLSHDPDDPAAGAPLCADCYDWASAVIWQWWAPELWRRTTIGLRRRLAHRLAVPESGLQQHASLQFAKVIEFQARGLVHLHVLLRLDGPHGPGSPAPLTGDALEHVVEETMAAVEYLSPPVDDHDQARRLCWGRQHDVRVVRQGRRTDDPGGPLTPDQVAGYLAKYATKDAGQLRGTTPRPHLQRLRATATSLAHRAHTHDHRHDAPYRLLGKRAHDYGYRGHFSSKSRLYSLTLGRIRRARRRYAQMRARGEHPETLDLADLEARLLAADDETTLVIGHWTYQGTGWPRPGDQALALAVAARTREYGQWRADLKRQRSISERNER